MPKLASVLLVDDDATTNFLNQALIQRLAIAEQLLVAANGQEALQTLHQTNPALILLDMNMPVMNGIEFLEAYQQLSLAQPPVIILLTTSLLKQDLERVQQLPVAGVVPKPLTKEKLYTILQQHFPE